MPDINTPETIPEAHFHPVSRHAESPQSTTEKLVELSKDIGSGIATVMQLLEFDELEAEQERPLFTNRQRGELLRFSIAAATLLSEVAERDIDLRNAQSNKSAA
jgi:hypothetical protein